MLLCIGASAVTFAFGQRDKPLILAESCRLLMTRLIRSQARMGQIPNYGNPVEALERYRTVSCNNDQATAI